jgi:hypothetical protein
MKSVPPFFCLNRAIGRFFVPFYVAGMHQIMVISDLEKRLGATSIRCRSDQIELISDQFQPGLKQFQVLAK